MKEDMNNGFSIGRLFSQTFMPHNEEEVESLFCVGSRETTPTLENVRSRCPTPWFFLRILLGTLATYLLIYFCCNEFNHNSKLIPGLVFTRCIFIPLGVLMFFFEMNICKNITIYTILKLLLVGSILSIFLKLVLQTLDVKFQLGAFGAAFIEEPAKLLVLLFYVRKKRYPYILNGLLLGAAVGTGFAIFESAGRNAFEIGLIDGKNGMVQTIITRGMLSIFGHFVWTAFGHIIWTALAGGALWMVKGMDRFRISMLLYIRFLAPFFCAIGLHYAWNNDLWQLKSVSFYDKYFLLGLLGWALIVFMLRQGMKQVEEEKQRLLQDDMDYIDTTSSEIVASDILEDTTTANNPQNTPPNNPQNDSSPQPIAGDTYLCPAPPQMASAPPEPSESPQKPHRQYADYLDNDDPLRIARQKRESKAHEEKRQPPDHSGKGWKRQYR